MLKKLIKIKTKTSNISKIICLQYENKFGNVTLGGDQKLQDLIWDIYSYCFDECDGEPEFHSVTRGCIRLKFRSSVKNYNKAIDRMVGEGYEVVDTKSFGRMM